jgi:hypothetical protein
LSESRPSGFFRFARKSKGVVEVALMGLVLLAVLAIYVWGGGSVLPDDPQARAAFGFGPEWACSRPPNGEPVCVKRVK